MELWFAFTLLTISLAILSWYCFQLAIEKGYNPWLFGCLGLIPVVNFFSLVLLYALPDKFAAQHKLYFSKFRQGRWL
jgi:magnesium-transporting ATPase (P-type)